jgi:hypothetical protein
MSQCRKNRGLNSFSRYLLIFSVGLCLLCLSFNVVAQTPPEDPRLSKDRPQPPPHPKPPSLKKIFSKINIFKKNKDSAAENGDKNTPSTSTATATAANTGNKKPEQAIPVATEPQPTGIKPTTSTTSNSTPTVGPMGKPASAKKKVKKTTKPATNTKTTTTAPII